MIMIQKNNPQIISKLFPLIDDQNPLIRKTILDCFAQHKSDLTESLMLNYMEKKQFQQKDAQHILACYKALGGCAGSRAISILQNILLGQRRNAYFGLGKLLHRQGAALALISQGSDKAKEILAAASRSSQSVVRLAVQKALDNK